ncbi:MAG TPA: hypothetical protein VHR66_16450 [Gemmataceae bacterium]|nr:hypothetical protein [Gemmataceae bacterium]
MSTTINAPNGPSPQVVQLAESVAQLAQSLHEQHDVGLVAKARERLGAAIYQAEAHAPNAVGFARGVIDLLASIGI